MRYQYYNPNPVSKTAGDCVIRAICKATGKSWGQVYAELSVEGYAMGDWGNSNAVWDSYLRRNGFKRYSVPDLCPECYTIAQYAADNPAGIYILATGSHVVTVQDGVIYDTWDSSQQVPLYYYVKE
jgi:hypothetical protein